MTEKLDKRKYDRERLAKWRKDNPDIYKARTDRYREEYPDKVMFREARYRAKQRGFEFNLELEDIKIPDTCPVLGIPLKRGRGARADNSLSLDRLDNTKGYIKGNVWVISWRANRMKWNSSLEDLESLVRAMRKAMKLPSRRVRLQKKNNNRT